MATLPLLKSGQIAQYPIRRSVKLNVDTVAFVDGGEQRCAMSRSLHEWTIQLGLIDEAELSALGSFVQQQQGQAGHFQFTDPADGTRYNNCSLALDTLSETFVAQGRVMTALVIRENPN